MSPTHGSDSPQAHPPERDQSDPVPLPRAPRNGRLRSLRLTLRHPRPPRPSTVWPCAQDDLRGDIDTGTGLIASWLLTAVVKIVTTYTQPGQRVLLLAPTPFVNPSSMTAVHPSAAVRTRPAPGPYAGLHEAAWTVVRLGRGIQTQTAGPPDDTLDRSAAADPQRDAGTSASESKSGLRPHPDGPDPEGDVRPSPGARHDSDRTPAEPGSDRFDLVITAAEPRTLDWLTPTRWTGLLTPTGTLAVITRSDHSRGRLREPAGSLVTAAHRAGLRYHDRIALVRVPIRNDTVAVGATVSYGPFRPPHGPAMDPLAAAVRHTQAHDDLLVFSAQTGTGGEERSDA